MRVHIAEGGPAVGEVVAHLSSLPEMEEVLTGAEACARHYLAPEMEGDVTVDPSAPADQRGRVRAFGKSGRNRRERSGRCFVDHLDVHPMVPLSKFVTNSSRSSWLANGARDVVPPVGVVPSATEGRPNCFFIGRRLMVDKGT